MISIGSAGRGSGIAWAVGNLPAAPVKNLRDAGSELMFVAALTVLYSAIASGYFLLPLITHGSSVLVGSVLLPADALLEASILEWGFHSIFTAQSVFDWNAGFPLNNTLATTENLLGWQFFYTPLRAAGVSVAFGYNALILGSLVISGIGSALLARRLGADRAGAAAAGIIFAYGPFHLNNMMHLQTMSVCWTPFAILFLDRCLERVTATDAIGLVASFGITLLSGVYFGLFLTLILPLYAILSWVFGRRRFSLATAGRLGLIGVGCLALASPLALPYMRFVMDNGWYHESPLGIASLSIEWSALLRVPAFQIVWASTPLRWVVHFDGQPAFLGAVALVLTVGGVIDRKRSESARAVVLILVTLSLVCYVMALGPYFKTGGRGASTLVEWVPMPGRLWLYTPGIRWPARFLFFSWLGASIVGGLGLAAWARKIGRHGGIIFASCALLLLVVEYWPAQWLTTRSVEVTAPLAMSDAYPFLAREADAGGIIEFPTSSVRGTGGELKGLYLYGASGHLRRVTTLLGTRMPALTDSLEKAGGSLPSESGRSFLSRHGVTRIVVHRFLIDPAANERLISSLNANRFPILFNGTESVIFDVNPTGNVGSR